jgi:hypothetical protein
MTTARVMMVCGTKRFTDNLLFKTFGLH